MDRFDLLQPGSVEEALALLARHGDQAQLIAGGAMLAVLLRERLIAPRFVVDIANLPSLAEHRLDERGLRLGAGCTLRTIERAIDVWDACPVLVEATRLVGNVRVRNVATIGGHLAQADPHLDLPPVLIALDASAEIRSARGERTVHLDELIKGYYETSLEAEEMITSVFVPRPPPDLRGVYLKYCSLSPHDWPTVGVAAFLRAIDGRIAEARVVVGCVSDRPLRLPEAEALLLSQAPSSGLFTDVGRRYASASDPLSDVRGSADYKRRVTEVYVRRALEGAARRAGLEAVGS